MEQGTPGMANKGPSYGLSRQVQDKIDKKYDPELEQRLVEWIMAQCGCGVGKPAEGKQGFQDWLKDGCVSDYVPPADANYDCFKDLHRNTWLILRYSVMITEAMDSSL